MFVGRNFGSMLSTCATRVRVPNPLPRHTPQIIPPARIGMYARNITRPRVRMPRLYVYCRQSRYGRGAIGMRDRVFMGMQPRACACSYYIGDMRIAQNVFVSTVCVFVQPRVVFAAAFEIARVRGCFVGSIEVVCVCVGAVLVAGRVV